LLEWGANVSLPKLAAKSKDAIAGTVFNPHIIWEVLWCPFLIGFMSEVYVSVRLLKQEAMTMGAVSAHDVAAYIFKEYAASMTTWKFQKLLYYSQAWSLVWDEEPLFFESIKAWENGPVVPEVYYVHKGVYKVSSWAEGDSGKLDDEQRATVIAVLKHYGSKTGQQLSDLTHRESPWRDARKQPEESPVISLASMGEFYSSIAKTD
jgi:uncharacterized phage-associated protein